MLTSGEINTSLHRCSKPLFFNFGNTLSCDKNSEEKDGDLPG